MVYLVFEKTHWGGHMNTYISDDKEIITAAQNSGGGASYDWLAEEYPEMEEFDLDTSLEYLGHDLQTFCAFDEHEIKEISKHGRRALTLTLKDFSTAEASKIIELAKEYVS